MSANSTRRALVAVAVLAAAGAAYLYFSDGRQDPLPPGIATGNGRLEATEVEVVAKAPGRLLAFAVKEGDDVAAGQVLAQLDEEDLKAPIDGRVLYHLVKPGEPVVAGRKVMTLLHMADLYLSIDLSADDAGRIAIGDPARIVLDAQESEAIPARVASVAPHSQVAPKEGEARNGHERPVLRVKLRLESDWLAANENLAKPGMPGVGYVLTEGGVIWPKSLAIR